MYGISKLKPLHPLFRSSHSLHPESGTRHELSLKGMSGSSVAAQHGWKQSQRTARGGARASRQVRRNAIGQLQ